MSAYLMTAARYRVFLLALTLVSICALAVKTQGQRPRTVLDYYRLLPGKYFEANFEQRMNFMLDPKRGAIVDVPNGYLFAPGDGAQTDVNVRLFKKADGQNVIAVKSHAPDSSDLTYLDFYVYHRGSWVKVTKAILSVQIKDELKYEIPRRGKTIRVADKRGRGLYDLIWSGKRFKLQHHSLHSRV
jgi:hypothetical protein